MITIMSGFINFFTKKANVKEEKLAQAWEYYIEKEEDEELRLQRKIKERVNAKRVKKEADEKAKQEEMYSLLEYQKYRNITNKAHKVELPRYGDITNEDYKKYYDFWNKIGINEGFSPLINRFHPEIEIGYILKLFNYQKLQVLDILHSDKALSIFAEYKKQLKDCYVPKVNILTASNSTIYKIIGTLQSEYADVPVEVYYSDITKEWYEIIKNETVYKNPDNVFEACSGDYFQNIQMESSIVSYNEQCAFIQAIMQNIDDKKVCG